jgi:ectoine hydroxylase-related dioxygenase (phytanoyl-CoA dioxygenase family)
MRNYNSLNKKIILGLKKKGYYIVNNFLNNYECNKFKIRLQDMYEKSIRSKNYIDERSGYGQAIIRDVVLKDPKFFLELIDKKLIINVLSLLLKDKFILDGCVGSNSINVGSNHDSLVHIDSHLPTKDPEFTSDVVVMYFFDNFTKENGATKIWPKSHLSGIRIQNDPNYKKNIKKKFKYVESNKGSIVFF